MSIPIRIDSMRHLSVRILVRQKFLRILIDCLASFNPAGFPRSSQSLWSGLINAYFS